MGAPPSGAHVIPGRRPVAEALRAGRDLDEIVVGADARVDDLVGAAEQAGVAVRRVGRDELDTIAGGVAHQGIVAVGAPFRYAALTATAGEVAVVLDGVTDPQNLGAVARSAEAAGADVLVLPKRRSAHVTAAAEKAAAGAFSWLPVVLAPNLVRVLADLADRGLWSVGLDGRATASVWEEPLLDGPVALVVGAEGRGLSRLVAERCDALAAIPLAGRVDSLNAAAAATVALFEIRRRRAPRP